MITRAVFLDKDGTLVRDLAYNVNPDLMSLASGALRGVAHLARAGYRLYVVSNQSGVARGYFPESALEPVRNKLEELLRPAGVRLDAFLYCPHHPDGAIRSYSIDCGCRKPKPGMILRAAREDGLDLRSSWLVGDILDDIEAGRSAGCRTILIDAGTETEWRLTGLRRPHAVAADLAEAASIILEESRHPHLLSWPRAGGREKHVGSARGGTVGAAGERFVPPWPRSEAFVLQRPASDSGRGRPGP